MKTPIPTALDTLLQAVFTACFTAPVVTAVAAVSGAAAALRGVAKDNNTDPVMSAYCNALATLVEAELA